MPNLKMRKKHQHQFIGVMTIEGYMWCQDCDKWIRVEPPKKKDNKEGEKR